MRRKMRVIVVAGLAFMLTLALVGGAVSAKPETPGGLRWIVKFEDGVNFPAKQRIIDNVGGVIDMDLEHLGMAIVWLPIQAEKGLETAEGVRWVEKDSYRYYTEEPQPLPWGIDRIDAEEAWKAGNTGGTAGGQGINVAVLDTGIDTDHPDLAANLEGGYSCVGSTSAFEDKNGHGTHCSGIIAALNNDIGVVGVGTDIDLWMVQVSNGSVILLSNIVEGINWCVGTLTDDNPDNNIQVMSMSFGGGYSQSEDDALQTAYDAGIVLVSSAGNEGPASEGGSTVTYPAALDTVIAVSATDSSDNLASFSSTGPEVELAAPGKDIYSTYLDGGYETLSGTSMAGPHVSGAVALVLNSALERDLNADGLIDVDYDADGDGAWDPAEVRVCLADTAEDIGLSPEQQGNGLVDAENAALGTTSGNNLAPPATGTITGTVTDAGTGDPIDGATVTADGYSTTTASDGTYTLADLPVGSYTVTASATGYDDQSKTADVLENDTTVVDFALTPSAETTGTMHVAAIDMWYTTGGPNFFVYTKVTIVDADDVAVPGATVYLDMTLPDGSKASGSGDTADDGTVTFKLRSRQTGTYTSTVTDVVKDGWTYDSTANVETSDSLTVP